MARIRVGFVERLRKKRSRKCAFIHVGALSQPGELGCIGLIEGDVETSTGVGHEAIVHESARYVHSAPESRSSEPIDEFNQLIGTWGAGSRLPLSLRSSNCDANAGWSNRVCIPAASNPAPTSVVGANPV